MPDTALADGTVLTSSFYTSNIRQQVVAQVTSGGKPSPGTIGRLIANTTDGRIEVDDGSTYQEFLRWTGSNSYTPTISQGVSTNIGKTTTYSAYVRQGNIVEFWFDLAITANGTAGSAVTITLPVAASGVSTTAVIGTGYFADASAPFNYAGPLLYRSGDTCQLISVGYTNFLGVDPNIACANGDAFRGHVRYVVA